MKKIQVKELCISALGICLVFCATFLIKIPNGFQGYFNCGDGMILAFVPFVNPLFAFLIGGVGSAIADIVSGYASYALFTLVIKGIEGLLISILISRFKSKIFVFSLGAIWMVIGYFIADSFVNQSLWIAVLSMPINLIQGITGCILGFIQYPILKKIHKEEQ